MALVPNTPITATLVESRDLAIMMARKTIAAIQTDEEISTGLLPMDTNDPNR